MRLFHFQVTQRNEKRKMTITLNLTDEEEAKLKVRFGYLGLDPVLDPAELVRQFITSDDLGFYDYRKDPAYSSEWTDEDIADAVAASVDRFDEREATPPPPSKDAALDADMLTGAGVSTLAATVRRHRFQ
jgi:hypothetical protein